MFLTFQSFREKFATHLLSASPFHHMYTTALRIRIRDLGTESGTGTPILDLDPQHSGL